MIVPVLRYHIGDVEHCFADTLNPEGLEERYRYMLRDFPENDPRLETITIPDTDPEAPTLIPPAPANQCPVVSSDGFRCQIEAGHAKDDHLFLRSSGTRDPAPTLPDLRKHFEKIRSDDAHRPILEEARRLNDDEVTR